MVLFFGVPYDSPLPRLIPFRRAPYYNHTKPYAPTQSLFSFGTRERRPVAKERSLTTRLLMEQKPFRVHVPKKGSCRGSFKGNYHQGSIRVPQWVSGLGYKGPCAQTEYTWGPKVLHRDYFNAKVSHVCYMDPSGRARS